MELISRILDGSIPESLRASLPPSRFFGPRVTQDDKITRLEEVTLLAECSRKQLKAVAKITDVDRNEVRIKTEHGTFEVPIANPAGAGIRKGDTVQLDVMISPTSPSALPRR